MLAWMPCDAQANPWIGKYTGKPNQQKYKSLIRQIEVEKRDGNRMFVQLWLETSLSSDFGPIKLVAKARGYSDFNDKGTSGDTLVASFVDKKHDWLLLLKQDMPVVPVKWTPLPDLRTCRHYYLDMNQSVEFPGAGH